MSSALSLLFASAKIKVQISCGETAQLISAFVFATSIVQSFYFLNLKFHVSSILLWLYSPFFSDLVRNPKDRLSHGAAYIITFSEQSRSIGVYDTICKPIMFAVFDAPPYLKIIASFFQLFISSPEPKLIGELKQGCHGQGKKSGK